MARRAENRRDVPELWPRQLRQSAHIAQLSVSHSDPLNHDVAGQPGVKDEPQHELMSQITQSLLETMRIRNLPFSADAR